MSPMGEGLLWFHLQLLPDRLNMTDEETASNNLLRLYAKMMSPEAKAANERLKEQRRLRAERVAKRSHVQSKDELVIGGLYRNKVDSFLLIVGKEGERFLYFSPDIRGIGLHYVIDDGDYEGIGRENHCHWCNLSRIA
jgi:hypothetical protein